jgi:hypothetical protein
MRVRAVARELLKSFSEYGWLFIGTGVGVGIHEIHVTWWGLDLHMAPNWLRWLAPLLLCFVAPFIVFHRVRVERDRRGREEPWSIEDLNDVLDSLAPRREMLEALHEKVTAQKATVRTNDIERLQGILQGVVLDVHRLTRDRLSPIVAGTQLPMPWWLKWPVDHERRQSGGPLHRLEHEVARSRDAVEALGNAVTQEIARITALPV